MFIAAVAAADFRTPSRAAGDDPEHEEDPLNGG